MEHQPTAKKPTRTGSKTTLERSCALIGNPREDAAKHHTTANTSVPDAEKRITALRAVLELRRSNATSPYRAEEWERQLQEAGMGEEAEFIGRG